MHRVTYEIMLAWSTVQVKIGLLLLNTEPQWQNAILFSEIYPCNDVGAIRLSFPTTDGEYTFGRLEYCYDGYWGSVCDDGADNVTADVACRQLGHREGQMTIIHNLQPCTAFHNIFRFDFRSVPVWCYTSQCTYYIGWCDVQWQWDFFVRVLSQWI